MRLVENSEQNFGKWARRLVTMEKLGSDEADENIDEWEKLWGLGSERRQEAWEKIDEASVPVPAHKGFREVYFTK
jgi:hypothetical protein